jgi:UDPglucose 6-dehydrogenase
MKITIAGYGFVGKAHHELLKDRHDIEIVDPAFNDNVISQDTDGVIVCVSTPQDDDGSCYMENVYNVIEASPDVPILVKSTISLEGWETIVDYFPNKKISYSPEFLRAATATQDVLNAEYTILGNDDDAFWENLFSRRFSNMSFYHCTAQEAVAIKCSENSFLALKVSFFNQLFDYCEAKHIDFNIVRSLLCKDKRINDDHSFVTAERGWGGHCFPKDTAAWISSADKDNVDLSIMKTALEYNKKIRKPLTKPK